MAEAQRLIDGIEPSTLASLRDRAIIGVMGYAWASLDAALGLRVRDYYVVGDRHWLRLIDNGAERYELVDGRLKPLIDVYLAAAGIGSEPHTLMFQSIAPPQRVSGRSVPRRVIVELIRSFRIGDYSAEGRYQPMPSQSEIFNLINSIDGSHTIARRDRAILGMLAYAGASILDVVNMKVDDFYKIEGEYWVRVPSQMPVKVAPELVVLMRDYSAAIRRDRDMPFLFGRSRVRPLIASDVREIFRRYREGR